MALPDTTQQPIIHVDATPNEEYPLRILRTYRENCNCKWVADPANGLVDIMNADCDKRAVLLDKAIAILEEESNCKIDLTDRRIDDAITNSDHGRRTGGMGLPVHVDRSDEERIPE